MPIAVIGYLAAVFLIPAESHRDFACGQANAMSRRGSEGDAGKHSADTPAPSGAEEIDRRCSTLDERLVRLEKHVTSRRFQLDQELSRL